MPTSDDMQKDVETLKLDQAAQATQAAVQAGQAATTAAALEACRATTLRAHEVGWYKQAEGFILP